MANPATLAPPAKKAGPGKAPARQLVPFIRASYEHREGAFLDVSNQIAAGAIQIAPADVPAFGYARFLWLLIECTSGVLGAGALNEDYPFVLLNQVTFKDINGAPIVGPHTGYDLYLINKWGGYTWASDPTADPFYVGTINAVFALIVPLEITRFDGYGSLGNMNSAANYKLEITLAASATAFNTAPTTTPTVRVRAYLDAWQQPAAVDAQGNPNQVTPPGNGTIQFWSVATAVVQAGDQTIRLPRVGNLIRNLIFVYRDDSSPSVRTTTEFPDPLLFNWDARQVYQDARSFFLWNERHIYGLTPDTGVFVYCFTDDQDGHAGNENRHLWLPTVQATRLEIRGTFGGSGGSLRIITNDVAPVGGR